MRFGITILVEKGLSVYFESSELPNARHCIEEVALATESIEEADIKKFLRHLNGRSTETRAGGHHPTG